jgi:hypothetical protein
LQPAKIVFENKDVNEDKESDLDEKDDVCHEE